MKKQTNGNERPAAAGPSSLRGLALWGVCLGGIGIAIVANAAREANNPDARASAPAATMAAAPAPAAAEPEPLSSEYRPSSHFPGVMVRSLPSAQPAQAPAGGGSAASRAKRYGSRKSGVTTRDSAGSYGGTQPRAAQVAPERKLKGGGAAMRFNRALYPRERIATPKHASPHAPSSTVAR